MGITMEISPEPDNSKVKRLKEIAVSVQQWQGAFILAACFALTIYFKKLNTILILLAGSIGGFLLLKV